MKNNKPYPRPARSQFSILKQICNLIPPHLVPKLARETGVDKQARTFSPWSHLISLIYCQLAHCLSLNDVCDSLHLRSGPLSALRGATPPNRNTFSHANKIRSWELAQKLFYNMLDHLQNLSPSFMGKGSHGRVARRFKRVIHVVDATTIGLVANCMDWARHRRRKAAAKCHMRLDLRSFLPRFAIVNTARESDCKRAYEVCAAIREGEIVVFDRAYVDFSHLADLSMRGVFWVTRAKSNMQFRVVKKIQRGAVGNILRDDLIRLKNKKSRKDYPELIRRIVALVEADGRMQEMVFLTNNLIWSAASVAELYRCRWRIEVFFKQLKQTLQLGDFLGHNANAVKLQVWMALLVFVLLRFLHHTTSWGHSFSRLFTVLRSSLWQRWDLKSLLEIYGTAGGQLRMLGEPGQAYLPGFTPSAHGTASDTN
jgi:hypothetical protein